MQLIQVPRNLSPENTTLILDFEGAITKKNLSYYLFQLEPFATARDLMSSLPFSKSSEELVRNFKLRYENRLLKSKSKFRRFCKYVYENGLRNGLRNFLYVLNNDGYDYYIVSSSREKIVKGILGYLPAELFDKSKVIASTKEKFIWEEEKYRIAEELKKRYLIAIGDSLNDKKLLEMADLPFVFKSIAYFFSPRKPVGYKLRDFHDLKSLLDYVYYKRQIGIIF